MKYNWSDDSALWQIRHGEINSERDESAERYIRARMDGHSEIMSNMIANNN